MAAPIQSTSDGHLPQCHWEDDCKPEGPGQGLAWPVVAQFSLRLWSGLRRRHRGDRLQNAAGDLVRVSGRVRTPLFEVAFVTVFDEINRHTDGSPSFRQAVIEFVD